MIFVLQGPSIAEEVWKYFFLGECTKQSFSKIIFQFKFDHILKALIEIIYEISHV